MRSNEQEARGRGAVKAVDVALGLLLRGLDLSAWTVVLLSDSEVWPAYAVLDPRVRYT